MALILPLLCTLSIPGDVPDRLTAEFSVDFHRREFDPLRVQLVGTDAEQLASHDGSCGLRVLVPERRGKKTLVGVEAKVRVRGDFEITVGFRDLRISRPLTGSGMGVNLYLLLDDASRDAFSLRRFNTPKEGDVFIAQRAETESGGSRRVRDGSSHPTQATSGRLRLTRTGRVLRYLVAEGGGAFRQLGEVKIETAELALIRLAAEASGQRKDFTVCFENLNIRAEAIEEKLPEAAPTVGSGLTAWLLYGGLALSALLCAWWFRSVRSR